MVSHISSIPIHCIVMYIINGAIHIKCVHTMPETKLVRETRYTQQLKTVNAYSKIQYCMQQNSKYSRNTDNMGL